MVSIERDSPFKRKPCVVSITVSHHMLFHAAAVSPAGSERTMREVLGTYLIFTGVLVVYGAQV